MAWLASVLRVYSLQASPRAFGTFPSSVDSAQVSQPFTSNHAPPTHSDALSIVDRWFSAPKKSGSGNSESPGVGPRSVTPGSLRAGVIADPITVGPWIWRGASTPSRKRRMLPTSVLAWAALGAPARMAHGCGSPNITPWPTCRAPEYAREYQPRPVHSRLSVATLRAPLARSCCANAWSPRRSASSASLG